MRRYNFWKVGPPVLPNWIVRRFSKVMGFAPIIFWGRWGTPLPRRSEIHVVVGKPVFVEHGAVALLFASLALCTL